MPSEPMDITADDAQQEAMRRRDSPETYTTALMINADIAAVTEFMSKFNQNLPQFEKDFQMHLESYPDLKKHYKALGAEVAHKTFMQRYFFRCCDLVGIQRELEKTGIPKREETATTAADDTSKDKNNNTQQEKDNNNNNNNNTAARRGQTQRTNSFSRQRPRRTNSANKQHPLPQRAGSTSKLMENKSNEQQQSEANNNQRPQLRRVGSLSNNNVGRNSTVSNNSSANSRDSVSSVRFRGVAEADPQKRSAWSSEEAGQETGRSSALPPTPFQRQSTGNNLQQLKKAANEQQQQNQQQNPSPPTKIKPALKNPTSPVPPHKQTKQRWEDKGKYSPTNNSLPMPVRKISKHRSNDSLNASTLLDDNEGQDAMDSQKHMTLQGDNPSLSLKDKMNAWNKKAAESSSSSSSPLSSTRNINNGTKTKPPNFPNLQKTSQANAESSSSSNNNQDDNTINKEQEEQLSETNTALRNQGPPQREGSARDLIKKLESNSGTNTTHTTASTTTTTNTTDGTSKPGLRKWKSIPKPGIPKPPSMMVRPGREMSGNEMEAETSNDDSQPDPPIEPLSPIKKSSKNLMGGQTLGGMNQSNKNDSSNEPSNDNDNDDDVPTGNKRPSWKAQLGRRNSNRNFPPEEELEADASKPSLVRKVINQQGANNNNDNTNLQKRPSWADSPLVQKQQQQQEEKEKEQEETKEKKNGNDEKQKTAKTSKTSTGDGSSGFAALPFISPGGGADNNASSSSIGAKYTENLSTNRKKSLSPTRRGASSNSPNSRNLRRSRSPVPKSNLNNSRTSIGSQQEDTKNQPSWAKSRLIKQQNNDNTDEGEPAALGEKQANREDSKSAEQASSAETTAKPAEGTRVRRGRPASYRSSSRRNITATNSSSSETKEGGEAGAAGSTTAEGSNSGRSSVRDRLKQWGGKREKTDSNLSRTSSFSGRRSGARTGRPPASSSGGPEDPKSENSVSSRSSTRRGVHRSKSPSTRRSIRSASPAVRKVEEENASAAGTTAAAGATSVKDRLNNWGGQTRKTQESMPNRHPPRPTRSSDSLNSTVSHDNKITSNTNNSPVRGGASSGEWKPDPLAVKCVVRAERRRNAEDTYTQHLDYATLDPWEDGSEFEEFMGQFDLPSLEDDIQIVLAKHKNSVGFHFKRLVPKNKVMAEDFWKRYFYRCDEKRILRDLRRRESLGTLGQSMVFHNSSTDMLNVSRSDNWSFAGSRSDLSFTGDGGGGGGVNANRPPVPTTISTANNNNNAQPSKTISDKILKADENSVMSKGSLIDRLKQWNGAGKNAPDDNKKPSPFRKDLAKTPSEVELENQDSVDSLTIGDALDGLETDETTNVTQGDDKSEISRTSGSIKDRLKNWTKAATGGGKDATAPPNPEIKAKRVHRRVQSSPSSGEDNLNGTPAAPSSETAPHAKSSTPPIGSPTLRYSNRTSDKTSEPQGIKPSDLKRSSSANAAAAPFNSKGTNSTTGPTPAPQQQQVKKVSSTWQNAIR